jgi:hypothetical protein
VLGSRSLVPLAKEFMQLLVGATFGEEISKLLLAALPALRPLGFLERLRGGAKAGGVRKHLHLLTDVLELPGGS